MGIVTTDTSVLTKLKGYWSGNDIYFNNSEYVVLLKPEMAVNEAIGIIRKHIDSRLQDWIKGAITKEVLKDIERKDKKYLSCRLHCSGVLFTEISEDNPFVKPEWRQPQAHSLSLQLLVNDLWNKNWKHHNIVNELTKIWLAEHRSAPYKGVNSFLPYESAVLCIALDTIGHTKIAGLLDDLWQLAKIDCKPARFGLDARKGKTSHNIDSGKVILDGLTETELSLLNNFSIDPLGIMALSQVYRRLCRVIAAAEQILLCLVQKEVCLLPFNFYAVPKSVDAVGLGKSILDHNLNDGTINAYNCGYVASFLASTNMQSLADFPVDIAEHFPAREGVGHVATFAKILKKYALKNGYKEYPYADLKRRPTTEHQAYTPEWVKENEKYSQEWFDFVSMFWAQSKGGVGVKSDAVRDLCRWSVEKRDFKTPYDIQPEDLRNPFMDSEEVTFFEYLRDYNASEDFKASAWAKSTRVYSLVANFAKLPGSPLSDWDVKNPFDGVQNPFSRGGGFNKTKRPRMPDTLVEIMVETLLEPDESGVPTYRWVREEAATMDTATVRDPDDPTKVISVWCPSTANCLATILLTPIRGHQSRWLDQGLMDQFIFDLKTGQMVKNTHPLAKWRYENGKTHKQQYGSLSGVFQTEYDSLSDTDEFIFWVSTNKTQMWSADKKRGYPLPWPTGKDLMKSDNEAVRAAGTWLNRAYQVLKYQIEWMQRYDPNPHPVSFEHSLSDRNKINTDPAYLQKYPWFTPIFRNLAEPVKDERDGHQVNIHLPVSWTKLQRLFGMLAAETQKRLKEKYGRTVTLTRKTANGQMLCIYDVHDLRVRGITHLLELGVPLHVVQYLVGHSTMAMTNGYAKFDTPWIKEQVISAIKKRIHDFGGFDRAWQLLKEGKISPLELLVFPKHNGDTQVGKIAEELTAYVLIAGGVCRMGGPGSSCCQEGRLYTKRIEFGKNAGEESEEYGPTGGSCALCRFWATGPMFLQEQEYVGNLTSFKLGGLCRRRKNLYGRRNELEIAIDESLAGDSKHRLEFERLSIDNEISNATVEISTTQLDLALRAQLFEESETRMTRLRELLEENPEADVTKFELITGPIGENHDFKPEIIETCELGLVRLVIEKFRFLERKVVSMPEDVAMRGTEFADQLLEILDFNGGHLFQIRDHKNRAFAMSMLLNFFSYVADPIRGDAILQDAIDGKGNLDMIIEPRKNDLRQFAALVIGEARTEEHLDWEKMAKKGSDLFSLPSTPQGAAINFRNYGE